MQHTIFTIRLIVKRLMTHAVLIYIFININIYIIVTYFVDRRYVQCFIGRFEFKQVYNQLQIEFKKIPPSGMVYFPFGADFTSCFTTLVISNDRRRYIGTSTCQMVLRACDSANHSSILRLLWVLDTTGYPCMYK